MQVRELEPDVALNNGADFLGDSFVFTVAVGVVIFEARDKHLKEQAANAKKAQAEAARSAQAVQRWDDIERRVARITQEQRQIQARCEEQLRTLSAQEAGR